MATYHLESGATHPGSKLTVQENSARRSLLTTIRWGAVLAGVAVGISVQLVLTLLGIASGLSLTRLSTGDAPGTGALIWAGLSMLISALVGGYVASRMSGLRRKTDGMQHGVVSWAVTTLLFVMLATSAGGSLLSGLFSDLTQGARTMTQSGGGIAAILNQQLGTSINPQDMRAVQEHISSGRRDQAIDYMSSNMGVRRDRASVVVDQALILSGSPEQASSEGREAADRAVKGASTVAWTVFGVVVFSLALSLVGGVLGAMGAKRATWNEHLEESTAATAQTGLGHV
ncbi:MAG: hypothetical protein RL618_406 [Pseudomonadota bacterium]|jgi:hypothetical protein